MAGEGRGSSDCFCFKRTVSSVHGRELHHLQREL